MTGKTLPKESNSSTPKKTAKIIARQVNFGGGEVKLYRTERD